MARGCGCIVFVTITRVLDFYIHTNVGPYIYTVASMPCMCGPRTSWRRTSAYILFHSAASYGLFDLHTRERVAERERCCGLHIRMCQASEAAMYVVSCSFLSTLLVAITSIVACAMHACVEIMQDGATYKCVTCNRPSHHT